MRNEITTRNRGDFFVFYLELSGILLYYENINLAMQRAIACFYSLSVRVKIIEEKFAKFRYFSYLCINENKRKYGVSYRTFYYRCRLF